jgi:hypothetical protein
MKSLLNVVTDWTTLDLFELVYYLGDATSAHIIFVVCAGMWPILTP